MSIDECVCDAAEIRGKWRWAPGVGENGGARRGRARPRHAPSRDRRSRVRQHITRGFHSGRWPGVRFMSSIETIGSVLRRLNCTRQPSHASKITARARAAIGGLEVWSGLFRDGRSAKRGRPHACRRELESRHAACAGGSLMRVLFNEECSLLYYTYSYARASIILHPPAPCAMPVPCHTSHLHPLNAREL